MFMYDDDKRVVPDQLTGNSAWHRSWIWDNQLHVNECLKGKYLTILYLSVTNLVRHGSVVSLSVLLSCMPVRCLSVCIKISCCCKKH